MRSECYHLNIADIPILRHFIQKRLRRNAVEIEDRERMASGDVAAQAHARDVDVVLAHECSDVPDNAGTILVRHDEEDARRDYFHRYAVDADNPRVKLRAKESAPGRNDFLLVRMNGH